MLGGESGQEKSMTQTQCQRCAMDKSAEEIVFNDEGVCNFCLQAKKALKEDSEERPNFLKRLKKIKKDGRYKKYDCLIGLSGGADSSTALHYAVMWGLRPLCFSVDTGYNKKEADENILRMVEKLKVPFERRNIDLDKFRELQAAFLKSGVRNIEIPTDHVLMAMTYQVAEENNIKWIISGGNVATESVMPPSWGYNARDLRHIKDIYRKMTGKKLEGLPMCSLLGWNYYKWICGLKTFYILDYLKYNRKNSESDLNKEYGYVSTGEKHEENIFTEWFQNFYLFEKFGIDKRKAHYSSLINAGQMTRQEAMEKLQNCPIYPKLGIERKAISYERHSHYEYKTNEKLWKFIANIIRALSRPSRIMTKIGKHIKG